MKQNLHISASFDQPELVQNLVERLAYRRYELGFSKQLMPRGLKAIETSSTETYVSGTMAIDADNSSGTFQYAFYHLFPVHLYQRPQRTLPDDMEQFFVLIRRMSDRPVFDPYPFTPYFLPFTDFRLLITHSLLTNHHSPFSFGSNFKTCQILIEETGEKKEEKKEEE